MLWSRIKWWLRGYRTVDHGTEVDLSSAVRCAKYTLDRYARNRRAAMLIKDQRWAVMVHGWNSRKEDG